MSIVATRAPCRALHRVACIAIVAVAPAQILLREIGKSHLPRHLGALAPPVVADVDGDGDPDLLFLKERVQIAINDGTAVFREETALRLPSNPPRDPAAAAAGDLDGDGDADFVLFDWALGVHRLWVNDGGGRFVDAAPGSLPPLPLQVADTVLVDADGDGDLDCVASARSAGGGFAHVLFANDGGGRFQDRSATAMPPAVSSGKILVADVDGDLDADLLIAGNLLINHGGRFVDETATRLPGQFYPSSCGSADFDQDGDIDLILVHLDGTHTVRPTLLLNDGRGTFSDGTAGRVGFGPRHLAVGDFDGDGDVDLLADVSRVLRNNGRGAFLDLGIPDLPARCGAGFATPMDADGDGDLDVVATGDRNAPALFLNDGTGRCVDACESRCSPEQPFARGLHPFDADGDRDQDLLLLAEQPVLFVNDGDGRLSPDSRRLPTFVFHQSGVAAAGDVDGDGDADLVIAGDTNNPAFRLLLNDGRGFFVDAPVGRLPYSSRAAVAMFLIDVDGDRDVDLLVVNVGQSALLSNDGRGRFRDVTATQLPSVSAPASDAVVLDADGDRVPDLLLVCAMAPARLWLNDGAGRFTDATASHMPAEALQLSSATAADIDGDGDVDVFGLSQYSWPSPQPRAWLNDGTGRFTSGTGNLPPQPYTIFGELADVDDDGDPDLIGERVLWLNDGGGRFSDVTSLRTALRSDQVNAHAVADFDGDGDPDMVTAGAYTPLRFYFNHHRQLDAPLVPRPGHAYPIAVEAALASPGQLGLVLLGARRLPIPVAIGGLGLWWLDPAAPSAVLGGVPIVPPAGRGALPLRLPAMAALRRAEIHLQVLMIRGADPSAWRLGHAVRDVVW